MPQHIPGPSMPEDIVVSRLRRAFHAQRGAIAPDHHGGGERPHIRNLHADPIRDEPFVAAAPSQRSAAKAETARPTLRWL